jgi:O-antigen/teichoic acid export membrane protein
VALTDSQSSGRLSRLPLGALGSQVRAWLADGSDRSIAQRVAGAAFLIRVCSAALIYTSQILYARWMGTHEFGIYVYVWTWVLMIGDCADLGLATGAQRLIPEYTSRKSLDLLRGFLSRSRWLAVGSATAIALWGVLLARLLEPHLGQGILLPLCIACVTLPFYSLMNMQDGIARSYNWVHIALLPPFVVRHLIMLTLVSAAFLFKFPTDAATVITALAASYAITVICQSFVLNRKLKQTVEPGPKAYRVKNWYAISLPILMVEGCYLLLTSTDILVLQQFRTPEDVAIYYATVKTLTLIAFVHFAVSAAVGHRFSEYHIGGDRKRLEAILSDSIRWTFWGSLAAAALILAMGRPLLSLFGEQFAEGYHLMFILVAGLLARAAVGPVERLLNMLGQQSVCAAVYGFAFVLNLVLCIVLIPRIGVEGAAAATSTALIVESILLFCVTKCRLGLHVFIWGRP